MTDSQETIRQMIKMIDQEAKEKANQIAEDAKHRLQIEKNRIYKEEREKLIKEFQKREDNDIIIKKTETSRNINDNRLRLQEERMLLIDKLRGDVMAQLKNELTDKKKYKKLIKELIVQGLIRLMEDDIKLRCLPKDNEVVKSVISEAAQEYSDFLKKETGIQKTVKIELVESVPLEKKDTELGGVMLYCARNRIVFTNTIDQRFKICVQDSIPDFRNTLFPSLSRPPLERKQPEAAHHE